MEKGVGPRRRRPLGKPRGLGASEAAHLGQQCAVEDPDAREVCIAQVEVAPHDVLDVFGSHFGYLLRDHFEPFG